MDNDKIIKDEIRYAAKQAKTGKAVGSDDLPAEIVEFVDEDNLSPLEIIFNRIHDVGRYPSDWFESIFIPLPKKNNVKKYGDHRLVSLKSHALKIFLKVLHNRVYCKCEANVANTQFGFRNSMGTR